MSEGKREEQPPSTPRIGDAQRLSLWTFRAEWIGWFYLLFVLQASPFVFALWWSEQYNVGHDNIASMVTAVASGSASLIFVAAVLSAIELEVVMVLRHLLEKREARKRIERDEAKFNEGFEAGRKAAMEEQTRRRSNDHLNNDRND